MWCSTCKQDMPGFGQGVSGRIVCSRCQRTMRSTKQSPETPICDGGIALDEVPASVLAAAPPFRSDEWATRQHVRNLGRELQRSGIAANNTTNHTPLDSRRFEPPQNLFDGFEHATAPSPSAVLQPPIIASSLARRSKGVQVLAWLIVVVGASILATGIGLMAWSLAMKQLAYWNLALGLSIGGQGTLILGLVLVVSRLWRNSRYAAGKLQDMHARLAQLQHTADTLTAMRSASAPAFYADLVRGASPHVLAANLKGQLDQLATRLGTRL